MQDPARAHHVRVGANVLFAVWLGRLPEFMALPLYPVGRIWPVRNVVGQVRPGGSWAGCSAGMTGGCFADHRWSLCVVAALEARPWRAGQGRGEIAPPVAYSATHARGPYGSGSGSGALQQHYGMYKAPSRAPR